MRRFLPVALGALIVALAYAASRSGLNGFYLHILFMIGVNYLAAAGLNVLVGYAGQKSLGHAGLFAVGAYAAALGGTEWGLDPWIALALAGALGGLFGLVIAAPAVRVAGPSLAMVTIGFGIVMEKIATEWTDVFKGQAGVYGITPPSLLGSSFSSQDWVWFVALLGVLTHLMLSSLLSGRFGRAFLAVQLAEPAAASVGISVRAAKTLAFVISAVTCAVAGALVAQENQYFNSDFISFNLSVFLLVVVIFGGSGHLYGPLLGAVTLTLIDAWLARWPALQHFAYGGLLLFALYAMPKGLAGALQGLTDRLGWTGKTPATPVAAVASVAPSVPTPAEAGPLIETRDLVKRYGGVVPTDHVSLTVAAGRVHALIGPNGAGKTTLLNLLSGHVAPDSGTILFRGRDITKAPAHAVAAAGIGRTFQNLRLFADMSVIDNVLVGAHLHIKAGFLPSLLGLPGQGRAEALARAEAMALLDSLGLAAHAESPAQSLPYGLQRRLEMARALASRPKLLLLDEPAAGLNPQETHELGAVIKRIQASGVTILLIEHHMDLVMEVSDHVIVLDYGAKIAEGPPAAIKRDRKVIAAYLGTEAAAPEPAGVQ
ncbi:MAG: branched-chain amino acid ABC transporter ATP-binding protein/permease [Rhizobiales bacterium]|nr:branched-chain amino acid ABC transporter ATP-binding protein/permease [Hyphomicrobiales bacterium]